MGRGLEHFRTHGAKLMPPPDAPDLYEDEAYRLLAFKAKRSRGSSPRLPGLE
jgi:hypothetical protein